MKNFNEDLWQAEKQNRRRLFLGFAAVVCLSLIFFAAICFWITQPLIYLPDRKAAEISVGPDDLKKHIEKLTVEFSPRSFSFPQNLDKTADYIKQRFAVAGGEVVEQEFKVNQIKYRNVIARFGSPTKERIVIGAHYDAAGDKPGADDNASGIAGLIELARLFGSTKLSTQVELVAYTLEEPPFFGSEQMGSFVHAQSLKKENAAVRLMIALEMIGYFSDAAGSQKYPVSLLNLLYPARGDFIAVVGSLDNAATVRRIKSGMMAASNLPVYSINSPTFVNGVDFSDHRNYWHFGFNALMITDTAFYRNPNYHTAQDTSEKLDYNRMAQAVKAVYQAVIETAE